MHARCVREDTKQALKGNLQADGVQSRQTLFVRYCLRDMGKSPALHTERTIHMAVIRLTKENFQAEVMQTDKPVLIDFYADWCGPCQMVSPIVDEIAGERSDIKVCKVNVDEQMELAQSFGVSSIPTLVVISGGKLVKHAVGAQPKSAILDMLEAVE